MPRRQRRVLVSLQTNTLTRCWTSLLRATVFLGYPDLSDCLSSGKRRKPTLPSSAGDVRAAAIKKRKKGLDVTPELRQSYDCATNP